MLSANSQPVGSATLHGLQKQPSYFSFCSWLQPLETEYWQNRLRAVPIFPLEFVDQRKDIANTGALKSRQKSCFSFPRFPRASVRDVFLRLNELKRKNRACSQSTAKWNQNHLKKDCLPKDTVLISVKKWTTDAGLKFFAVEKTLPIGLQGSQRKVLIDFVVNFSH